MRRERRCQINTDLYMLDTDGLVSELAREKMWSRIHLIPMLQAEEDRDQVRRYWADKEREKALLGTDMKVYNSDRYVWILEYCTR